MLKFKNFIKENLEMDHNCFRIIRFYFYNNGRDFELETKIMDAIEFPILITEITKLQEIMNILVESNYNLKDDYLLSIINKYFNSTNNKEIMFNFIRDREPRLTKDNIDLESKQFAIDFHSRFAKS